MGRKRHKPEEIIAKLRQVDVLTAQGTPVVEAIRSIGVTEVTYYRWHVLWFGIFASMIAPCYVPSHAVLRGSFANPFANSSPAHVRLTRHSSLSRGPATRLLTQSRL
jgi:hypothetical protein